MKVSGCVTFRKLVSGKADLRFHLPNPRHSWLPPLSTVSPSRNSASLVIILAEYYLESTVRLFMTTVVLETQKLTKELCVLIVIYTTGDWNFITLITKLKLFHIKVTEPDPEQCLPMDDKCATFKHIFHTFFVYHIELANISHGRTVKFSQKTWPRPFRPKETLRVPLCVFYSHLRCGAHWIVFWKFFLDDMFPK